MKPRKHIKSLTQSEEQIMQILWDLEKAFVRDIRDQMPEPRPAYNTVSTIVRILEKKDFVSHRAYGNAHQYFPLITRSEYSKNRISSLLKNYFKNSYSELVSFFAREQNMSVEEMEEIMQIMDREIRRNQQGSGIDGPTEDGSDAISRHSSREANKNRQNDPGKKSNPMNNQKDNDYD